MEYSQYLPFATETQQNQLKVLAKTSSQKEAADTLGINIRTLERSLQSLKERAAKKGYAPDHGLNKVAPPSFEVSTLRVNSDGQYVPAYAKVSSKDEQKDFVSILIEASNSFKRCKPIKEPKYVDEDLLNLYTISDYHLGMLSWGDETGADWDLDIASDLLRNAFSECISRSPKSSEAIINILGDWYHIDDQSNMTPASGHVLDTDTRYYKLVETGIHLIRDMVECALKKHRKVTLLCVEGNHDPSSIPYLQVLLSMVYENEPRLEVVRDPKTYYSIEFGKCMLAFHHGHKRHKPSDLNRIFSSDPFFKKAWGRCDYLYGHTGHFHHEKVEDGGMIWTMHPTLSPRSAYESRGGWASQRACIAFTYSKKFGEISSVYVRPEMFEVKDA